MIEGLKLSLDSVQKCSVFEQDKSTRLWLILSHIGWFVVILQAYKFNDYWLLGFAVTSVAFSLLFHYTGLLLFEIIDTVIAIIYLMIGPVLLFLVAATISEWLAGVSVSCLALGIYSVSSWYRCKGMCSTYVKWHALWHLVASFLAFFIYAVYFNQIAF